MHSSRRATILALAALSALGAISPVYADLTTYVDANSFGGDTGRYNAAVASMQAVINRYNVYGDFGSYNIYVFYNSGIPTAQSDYLGSIGFGGTYPNERVAQHESNHFLGSGTTNEWGNRFNGNVWTGAKVNQLFSQFDGDGTVMLRSGVHFYPYGLNYDNEVYNDATYMRNIAIMYAMRQDMGIGNQANPWSATNVTLTASDAPGRSAFNWFGGGFSGNYGGWNDKYFAHSGAAYSTGAFDIRTPEGTPSWTFAGDSLTINAGGRLLYNSYLSTGRITINNLTLAGGTVRHDQFPADTFQLVSNAITVTSNSTFEAANGNIVVRAPVGGAGGLTFTGGYSTTLTAINTYAGGTTVNGGTLAVNAGGAIGAIRGALTINNGATVRLNAADALGTIAGASVSQITINGGTLDNTAAGNNGYNANVTLTGGTLSASGGGAYQINAGGGRTITSLPSATTSTISGNIVIRGANAVLPITVVDGAAVNDLVISGAIRNSPVEVGANGITKTGSGALVLGGANVYSGPTNVNAGTVAFASTQSNVGPVAVADSATLRVTAIGTNVATLNASALTAGNGGTSSLAFDFASLDTLVPLVSTGLFTANGSVNVSVLNAGALTNGLHPLVGYTAYAGNATFSNTPFSIGPRSTGTLVNDGTSSLGLNVVADRPVWTGGDSATWTAAATGANKNWKLQTALSATDYLQGDNVLFDDTAAGSTSVNISGTVAPSAVTFNNSIKTYNVSGGAITGTASVVKNGTAPVVFAAANSYSGGTTINAGRVIAGNASALGTGGVRMNGAALGSSTGLTVGGGLTVTGNNTLGYSGQSGDIIFNGGLSGAGTLTNYVGGSSSYTVQFNGDLGGFSGSIVHTGDSGAATGWWRVGQSNAVTNLANATVVLNKGNVTDFIAANKNFGFTNGITNATVNLGALSGDGVFQSSYSGSGPNTLAVGFLGTSTTFSGVIAGADGGTNMSLAKVGAGTLTLSGANRYDGNTAINGGAISVAANNNLGADGSTLSLNGGTLIATAGFASTHATTIESGGGTFAVTGNNQLFLPNGNALTGSGPLTVVGTGTLSATTGRGNLRLGAGNSYSGSLTLKQGGILEYGTTNALAPAATVRLQDQAEYAVNTDATAASAVNVSGSTNSIISFINGRNGVVSGPVRLADGSTLTVGLRDWYNTAIARGGSINGSISGNGNVVVNSGAATGGTLNLGGPSTFTGSLTVTNAVVAATYGANDVNTGGRPNGAFGNEQIAGRVITVNTGGTVSLAAGNVLGSGGSTLAQAPNVSFVINQGGALTTAAPTTNGAGGGDANIFGSIGLNGGTFTTGNGADANFQAAILLKDVTVGGTTASLINSNATNTVGSGIMLGDAASGTDSINFIVADATANASVDLTVSNRLTNSANSANNPAAIGAMTKSGAGTMFLSGMNTYTGSTTVTAGTLRASFSAYRNTVLGSGTGGLDLQGGRFVFVHGTGSDPLPTVKSILDSGYIQASKFSTGQIRSTTLAADRTVGYGDDGISLTVTITLPGDANLDGRVDFNDFLVLQNNFGQAGTRFDQGNFNYDGMTDFNDFLVLQNNFGQSLSGMPVAVTSEQIAAITAFGATSAVPEPGALVGLAALGMAGIVRRQRSL